MFTPENFQFDAIVLYVLKAFAILSTATVVIQFALMLAKKVLTEWRDTRDQWRDLKSSSRK